MPTKNKRGGRKASPKRYDKTSGKRANKRKAQSDRVAKDYGWDSWSDFTTHAIKGLTDIPKKPNPAALFGESSIKPKETFKSLCVWDDKRVRLGMVGTAYLLTLEECIELYEAMGDAIGILRSKTKN